MAEQRTATAKRRDNVMGFSFVLAVFLFAVGAINGEPSGAALAVIPGLVFVYAYLQKP